MDIDQMKVGFMAVFCYLVWCQRTREGLLIDPAGDEDRVVSTVNQRQVHLKYIVNTHGHVDHTCGNERVKALTGAKIIIHELTPSPPADITVTDGDEIVAGDVSLEVIHTPGHSPGGICLLGGGNLFSGDTLFVGGIGRTDLPGGSMSQFMQAIRERILTLPGETIVWPGHDYGPRPSSTIEIERKTNPWLS